MIGGELLVMLLFIVTIEAQDYEVTGIQCTFAVSQGSTKDTVMAKLRKPEGFKGYPIFANNRALDPATDALCQIRPDLDDDTGLIYVLKVTDFDRCGALKHNGAVQIRVWFPQFPGVVMQSDQEVIIRCEPPAPTIIENKAAGFAGSFPHSARVSGIATETPGKLEYEVALYKEAPAAKINMSSNKELPVDQAVPIGTKLQLRARINPDSAWKYVKLMEVTVSPDPDDPHMHGSVVLVKNGCRNTEFGSIIPRQPNNFKDRTNEVYLDFEAFLLSTMRERSTLWIHSQIKACMEAADCPTDFCLDLYDPIAHGRRRKRREAAEIIEIVESANSEVGLQRYNSTHFKKINGNLEYTVLMPDELFEKASAIESSCSTFLVIAAILGCLLFLAAFLMCWLASKLHSALVAANDPTKNVEDYVREGRHYSDSCYTGRATTQ